MFPTPPSATAIARLQAQARAEIHRLRGEASDDFWRGADAVWQRSQGFAQRSANRLKARLARHHRSTSSTTKA
ncbi:hypothetical protein [Rhodoferax saidenbachensis]|uniref:Uncharacterized protein n=1 Tax=Rhodoferax saidenbachensis TaxID=1484693 RepID=A0ABU1ZMD9_9BURK|nr:hypothetical protein [Rhodoferax saidenbachensis]MDR7306710.1 hypothetical protein [Rhodoferax saidenbachensis]